MLDDVALKMQQDPNLNAVPSGSADSGEPRSMGFQARRTPWLSWRSLKGSIRNAFRPRPEQNLDAKWKSGLCQLEQRCRVQPLRSLRKALGSRSRQQRRNHRRQISLRHCSRHQQHQRLRTNRLRRNLRRRRSDNFSEKHLGTADVGCAFCFAVTQRP